MASVVNETQVNFNPSWMQSVPKSERTARMDRTNRVSVSTDEELMPPVFAKNRYGREDILALIGKGTKPPDGLDKCSFFIDTPQAPIILQPLSDIEERLQQNINSSKALSSLPKSRQQLINGGASPDVGHSNTGWTTINNRGGTVRPGNRWSGLGSSGNGPGDNAGYRPGRGSLMRINSGGHNSNDAGNRWSGLSPTGTAIHDQPGYRPVRGGLNSSSGRGGGTASLRQISAPQPREPEKMEDIVLPSHSPEQKKSPPPLPKQIEREKVTTNQSTSPEEITTTLNNGIQPKETEKMISATSSPNILSRATHSTSPLKEELSKPEILETENKWQYLDPTDTQQGPFETKQMLLWYNNGFFKPDLRLRPTYSTTFTTLGDLIRINGSENPFVQREFLHTPRTENIPISQPVSSVFSNPSSIWGPPTPIGPIENQMVLDPETDKLWAAKQRQLAEESRKLKEKEEALKREEQERAEKERLMREKELELVRKQEEINRITLEREAKLRREQEELLNRERQLAEFERQKKEELERETQRLQLEMQRQRQAKEEEERRKQREIEEMIEREKEKQRIEFEAKLKREQQEKEESLHRAYEEMKEANRKKTEDEKLRRKIEDEERKNKARLEEEARKEHFEKERLRQISAERQQGKMRDDDQQKIQSPDADFDYSKTTPWVQISTKTDKIKEKQAKQESRTLAEIQEEELHQMKIQQQKQKELLEQQRKQMEPAAGVWGKPPTKSSSMSQMIGSVQKEFAPIGSSNASVWNVQSPPVAAPIPPAPKANNQSVKQAKKNVIAKKITIATPNNEFTKWITKRVNELNPSIDAEVFATFIESVDNPDDAEDYIVGYLGDSKDVKIFHRELINKRIEMRAHTHATPKDDLSKAAAATATATKNASGATKSAVSSNVGGGNKKKKGKGNEKVITGFTGFKTTGDPNRLNVGEIDNTPPVSNRKR